MRGFSWEACEGLCVSWGSSHGRDSLAARMSAACCCSGLGESLFSLYVFYSLWDGRLPESMACLPPILMMLVGQKEGGCELGIFSLFSFVGPNIANIGQSLRGAVHSKLGSPEDKKRIWVSSLHSCLGFGQGVEDVLSS